MFANGYWRQQLRVRRSFAIPAIGLLVGAHGGFIVATTLLDQLAINHTTHVRDIVVDLPLVIGLSLIYLGSMLRRRKRTAWITATASYSFLLALTIADLISDTGIHVLLTDTIVRAVILPLAVLGLLITFRDDFVVRSDIRGFRAALRFSVLLLVVAFFYGSLGFVALDRSDFHQEIGLPAAMHYTVDRFDLTTQRPVQAYTKRAHLFVDSLSVISLAALAYGLLALFQPIRNRLSDQHRERQQLLGLLTTHYAPSEDFFKLWPRDKHYFFNGVGTAGLAYHVYRGVALCLGDPIGASRDLPGLLQEFEDLCFNNDWQVALVHTDAKHKKLYEARGYELQHLGQEAIVDLAHFQSEVVNNKYFRQIKNRFTKQGFSCELLKPPHHRALLDRLKVVSDEWLSQAGRVERGFVMGYFSYEYLQQCEIVVLRDAANTIQAFLNHIPAEFDAQEATYDMLRRTEDTPGNSNDFLLMSYSNFLIEQNYSRLNLGLCPLVGIDEAVDTKRNLIDSVLKFAYANGDRFYSFSGLYRFKAKYEPEWSDRYLVFQGGVRGFTRTMNALMRAMKVRAK